MSNDLFFKALSQSMDAAGARMPKAAPMMHLAHRESTGLGPDGMTRIACSCGWRGPWRHESSDFAYTDLNNDEMGHA